MMVYDESRGMILLMVDHSRSNNMAIKQVKSFGNNYYSWSFAYISGGKFQCFRNIRC